MAKTKKKKPHKALPVRNASTKPSGPIVYQDLDSEGDEETEDDLDILNEMYEDEDEDDFDRRTA